MITVPSVQARAAITALLFFSGSAATLADTPPVPVQRELSKEAREKMAVLHEQMAACLRSDKSLSQCHGEMLASCQAQLGSDCTLAASLGHGTDGQHRMRPLGGPAAPTDR